jgi:hypothetical protein
MQRDACQSAKQVSSDSASWRSMHSYRVSVATVNDGNMTCNITQSTNDAQYRMAKSQKSWLGS